MSFEWKVVHRAADVVLIVTALALVGIYATRQTKSGASNTATAEAPKNWRAEIATGIRIGPRDAKLTIIEFMDFQCPYCARWAARVDSLEREFPGTVQVVFHHFPLTSIHQHAMQAAVAAECANRQGAFRAFQKAMFATQAEIGTKSLKAYAAESGVREIPEFVRCASLSPDSFPRIAHGLKLAAVHKMRGTPTVWVNGKVSQPTLQELRILAGKRNRS